MKIIIITGPPYSGKGTQCEKLLEDYDLVHVSTGEHIRQEKEDNTELGRIMSDYDVKGLLVPDEIMKKLLDKLITENLDSKGVILDGYPRTIPQVNDLIDVLKQKNLTIDKVLNIEVSHEELLIRAKERAESSDREDDKDIETHHRRIRVFKEETLPAIEFMKNQFEVDTFDGMGSIKEVTSRIKACIQKSDSIQQLRKSGQELV